MDRPTPTSMTGLRGVASAGLIAFAGLACMAPLAGCREDRSTSRPRQFIPDMDDSPKWKPQTSSPFFADGRTMRPTVPNTVAFGPVPFVTQASWAEPFMRDRQDHLREDNGFYRGVDASSNYLSKAPMAVTAETLALGAEKFNIYCAVCHGYEGDGQGTVGKRWASPVANFHDEKYLSAAHPDGKGSDGYLFHIGINGLWNEENGVRVSQRMPGYGHALDAREMWAVIAHIRVLQAHRRGTVQDAPADQREKLEQQRQQLIAEAEARAKADAAAKATATPPANTLPAGVTPPTAPAATAPKTGGQP
jgi:mono/diheme cytochrome c family protein